MNEEFAPEDGQLDNDERNLRETTNIAAFQNIIVDHSNDEERHGISRVIVEAEPHLSTCDSNENNT
jgi:hypothetical protein